MPEQAPHEEAANLANLSGGWEGRESLRAGVLDGVAHSHNRYIQSRGRCVCVEGERGRERERAR